MQDSGWRKYSQAGDKSGTEHAGPVPCWLKDRRNGSVSGGHCLDQAFLGS